MLGASEETRCPPGLGPTTGAGIFLVIVGIYAFFELVQYALFLVRGRPRFWWVFWTLIFAAVETSAFVYYYNRYARCDAFTGFFVYFLVSIAVTIVTFFVGVYLVASMLQEEAERIQEEVKKGIQVQPN